MSFISELEVMFATSSLKWNRAINEKDRVIYIVLFAELCEKLICDHVCSCRLKLCME
ncbi:hypothetical protein SAMN04488067_10875 [Halorubrum xinjiangense]|uniref:Uncharacterized protein n=1 Tax=Halorubrum xinjiangense TaxID=261291 RepID=A0A1G7NRC4_9EURY|nr:hypothetical protein SAMN04488067_10875 [Halorubrum xinjiangense]